MAQQGDKKAKKAKSEADHLRLGQRLYSEFEKHIVAGTKPPQLLRDSLQVWKEDAYVKSFQKDREQAGAWRSALGGLHDGMERAAAYHLKKGDGELGPGEQRSRQDGQYRVNPDFNQFPDQFEPWVLDAPPDSMESQVWELDPIARRTASIMSNPIQDVGGRSVVLDHSGMPWDLTEALETLQDPEILRQLRQSAMGLMPGDPLIANTVGAMPTMQLLAGAMRDLMPNPTEEARELGFGPPQKRYVPTLDPNNPTLPWMVGFGPGAKIMGDEEERMQDPVFARALKETMAGLDLEKTGLETFAHNVAFLADFGLAFKGAGAVFGGAARAAKALPVFTLPAIGAKYMARVTAAGQYVAPMNSPLVKTTASFMAHSVATQVFNPRMTVSDAAWEGFRSGITMSVGGVVGRVFGRAVTAVAKPTPIGTLFEKIFPRIYHAGGTGTERSIDKIAELMMRFTLPSASKTVAAHALAPHTKFALQQTMNAYWTGAAIHSFAEAQQAPRGDQFVAFWRGLFTANAAATGFAFALNGMLQYGMEVRPKLKEAMAGDAGLAFTRRMVEAASQPSAEPVMQDLFRQMRAWRVREKGLFEGIVTMNRAARERMFDTEAKETALMDRLERGDMSALKDIIGLTSDDASGELQISDRLDAYRAIKAREVAAKSGKGHQSVGPQGLLPPRSDLVGEIPVKDMRVLVGEKEGTSDAGVRKHMLNAVHEYLRRVDGSDVTYPKVRDIPDAVMKRALKWRDEGKPQRGQMSLDDAKALLDEVDGEAGYAGLAPAEKVAVAVEKKKKGRPSRGKALELVASGKKDADWLRETYPEGAHAVGDPANLQGWTKKWTDSISAVWKRRKGTQSIRRFAERKAELLRDGTMGGKPVSVEAWVRARGGISVQGLYPATRARIEALSKRKSKHVFLGKLSSEDGGVPLERLMLEAAREGWLGEDAKVAYERARENPMVEDSTAGEQAQRDLYRRTGEEIGAESTLDITPSNFIDALETGRFRRTAEVEGELEAMRDREVEASRQDFEDQQIAQVRDARAGIEDGSFVLPADDAARRDLLMEVYAGDERFEGVSPERVERQVMELRAQSEAGDPGAMLAGPEPTPVDLARRAAATARALSEDLKSHGLAEWDVGALSPEGLEAMNRLIVGEVPEGFSPELWGKLRERALSVRADTRLAIMRDMEGTWSATRVDELKDIWSFTDAQEAGLDVPKDVRDRLGRAGWLNEHGQIHTYLIDQAQQQAAELSTRLREIGDEGFSSFLSPFAFTGRKFTRVEDNAWGGKLTWQFYLAKPGVQEFLGKPWPRKVFKGLTNAVANPYVPFLNLGPISGPHSLQHRKMMEQFLGASGISRMLMEEATIVAQHWASEMAVPFRGARIPMSHHLFVLRGMEPDGIFARTKGPEDFERLMKGTGYLYRIYKNMRDTYEKLATERVALGLLTQGQADNYGGGRYMTHYYVTDTIGAAAKDVEQGKIPFKGQGRLMSREPGRLDPTTPIMRIPDAGYTFVRGVHEMAQNIRVFDMMRRVADKDGVWARTEKELSGLGAYDRGDYQISAVRIPKHPERTLIETVALMADTGKYPSEALVMGARIQTALDQMAPEGQKPKHGQTPYTAEKERLLKWWLGEGPGGKRYIPKSMAQEMEVMLSEVFALPGENLTARIGAVIDQIASFRKRGLTIMRPATWGLQILSNVDRNAMNGGVPRYDFMLGIAGLPSYTRDGITGLVRFTKLISEGLPSERPESFTEAEWAEAQAARRFLEFSGASTSTFHMMGPEFALDLGRAMDNPGVAAEAWKGEMNRRAKEGGWLPTEVDRMALNVDAFNNRMYKGLEKWDTKILGWLGEPDPVSRAKAMTTQTTAWNMIDLFVFKYPAFLKIQHEHPESPTSRVAVVALDKTSNVQNLPAWQKRFLSMRLPRGDHLWRAAQGTLRIGGKRVGVNISKATLKMLVAQVFRHRFFTDPATAIPTAIRTATGSWRGAGRALTSATIVAGAAALFSAVPDEEEKRKYREEAASARRAITRWPSLSDADEEALRRFGTKIGDSTRVEYSIPDWAVDGISAWWRQLKLRDPGSMPMPQHGGESRQGSISELSPVGQVVNRARAVGDLLRAPFVGESREEKDRFLRATEQLLGMTAQTVAAGLLGMVGGKSDIIEALGAKKSPMEVFLKYSSALLGTGGVFYPTLGLFTPEGTFMGEAIVLKGQRWQEFVRGIVKEYDSDSSLESLGGVGARYLWSSRSIIQREPLGEPNGAWSTLLGEMYGQGFRPGAADGEAKMRAHRWSMRQLSTMIGDLYDQHHDEYGEPGKADYGLDERMAGALSEFLERTAEQNPISGDRFVSPGGPPKTALLQAVVALPEGEQRHAIEHLRRWLSRENWGIDGLTMLWEAGRRLEMPKALFREAFMNAMNDPKGGELVRWWWSKVKGGDEDTLEQLAPLMWDIHVPASTSEETLRQYWLLKKTYEEAGMQWSLTPDNTEQSDEILGSMGQQRMMQGGRAFKSVLSERPLVEKTPALDSIFKPR